MGWDGRPGCDWVRHRDLARCNSTEWPFLDKGLGGSQGSSQGLWTATGFAFDWDRWRWRGQGTTLDQEFGGVVHCFNCGWDVYQRGKDLSQIE